MGIHILESLGQVHRRLGTGADLVEDLMQFVCKCGKSHLVGAGGVVLGVKNVEVDDWHSVVSAILVLYYQVVGVVHTHIPHQRSFVVQFFSGREPGYVAELAECRHAGKAAFDAIPLGIGKLARVFVNEQELFKRHIPHHARSIRQCHVGGAKDAARAIHDRSVNAFGDTILLWIMGISSRGGCPVHAHRSHY